jgi:hypothetical protein
MSSYSNIITQQVTLENNCLNSHELIKAAAESNEGDGNSEPKEALVVMASELSVFLIKD